MDCIALAFWLHQILSADICIVYNTAACVNMVCEHEVNVCQCQCQCEYECDCMNNVPSSLNY